MTTELIKSCISWHCTWKHKCNLYHYPRAEQHFSPEQTAEHCHYFVPIKRNDDD